MKPSLLLITLLLSLTTVCELYGEKLEWDSISARTAAIEKLRTTLPTPKPPIRQGALISLEGQTVPMPNGERAFVSQLGQIAKALTPKDQAGIVTLVSYLRDRDPHIRYLAALALELHLEDKGFGNEEFYPRVVTRYIQEHKVRRALEDLLKRIAKLPVLEDRETKATPNPGQNKPE